MKIYLVGGAVRDQLLGLAIKERDWVVVGATPEIMLQQGYRPVGKDFPVFLHPETHEEYALARTERSTGRGYAQFVFYTAPDVRLEEDLRRRDLTINAMAQDLSTGKIIDPYHGQQDLKDRVLRHVSAAFIEDPVRILRIARFAARYVSLGFTVADETVKLMRVMVDNGEVDALVFERVWQEFARALTEKDPREFFYVLEKCGALQKLFPEFLPYLTRLSLSADSDAEIRFATFLRVFSITEVLSLCQRYRIPRAFKDLALLVHQQQKLLMQDKYLSAADIMQLFDHSDAWRRPQRFEKLLKICANNQQKELLPRLLHAAKDISPVDLGNPRLSGIALGEALRSQRLMTIEKLMQEFQK